jgi:hypothetical protein
MSFPEKLIFFILILSPLLTFILRLRLFEPIESGVDTMVTLEFKNPSFFQIILNIVFCICQKTF